MANVFGFSTEPAGDFMPILKYDSRAGRLFRVDRENTGDGFSNDPVDITASFKAIVDFENVEVGWIDFAPGSAPDFRLVKMGETLPPRPSDRHKNGVRFVLKLAKICGGDQAESGRWRGRRRRSFPASRRCTTPTRRAKGKNAGKLPVIVLEKTTPIKSGSGERQSTNYQPTFKIVSWAPRGDLVFEPKAGTSTQQSMPLTTPPATGSTKVDPPSAATRETADADDFG